MTYDSSGSLRWEREGKKLLPTTQPAMTRVQAVEAAMFEAACLRMNFSDDFSFRNARNSPRHAAARAVVMHLEQRLRSRLRFQHKYLEGNDPPLTWPAPYSAAGASQVIDRILFAKSAGPIWGYFHSGNADEVRPEWAMIVREHTVEVCGPSEDLSTVTRLFQECLAKAAGQFVYAQVGIDIAGWPAVAHIRRGNTPVSSLTGVAQGIVIKAGVGRNVIAAAAIGAHGFHDNIGAQAALKALSLLGTVELIENALVVRTGSKPASPAVSRRFVTSVHEVLSKLRVRRRGRRPSAKETLPIFKTLEEALARTSAMTANGNEATTPTARRSTTKKRVASKKAAANKASANKPASATKRGTNKNTGKSPAKKRAVR